MTNPMMVCYYRSSCLYLPVALVDFQVDSFSLRLHHVFKEGYAVLNDIYFDGSEKKICCGCVDELRVWGKSETLKKVGDSTLYRTDESEEDEK